MRVLNKRFLTLIVKQTHKCNLQCPYCYDLKNRVHKEDMSLETVKEVLQKTGKGLIRTWTWHGGEPLLRGIEWYEQQNQMIKDFDCDISIALQTNGTLINDEWIKHFRKWGIRPGLSFDGLNNSNTRRNTEQLLRVFDKLKQADMDSGSIMVITRDSINNLIDEYEYQKKLGIYSQWNLIFEQDGNDNSYFISGDEMYKGVKEFLLYWFYDKNNSIGNSLIDDLFHRLLDTKTTFCENINCAGKWFQIDPNGQILPCGRDWKEDQIFGNIHTINSLTDVYKNENFKRFLQSQYRTLNNCKNCKWFYACHSGCLQNSYNTYGLDFDKPEPNYCEYTRKIFDFLEDFLKNEFDEDNIAQYNPLFLRKLQEQAFRGFKLINELVEE